MSELKRDKNGRILFTKEMKKEYTILVPDMLPIHFNIMKNVFTHAGYKIELLDNNGPKVKQLGLKYMHNSIIGKYRIMESIVNSIHSQIARTS